MFKRKYRITDTRTGHYDAQYKEWYLPFWCYYNEPSHNDKESALASLNKHIEQRRKDKEYKQKTVWQSSNN